MRRGRRVSSGAGAADEQASGIAEGARRAAQGKDRLKEKSDCIEEQHSWLNTNLSDAKESLDIWKKYDEGQTVYAGDKESLDKQEVEDIRGRMDIVEKGLSNATGFFDEMVGLIDRLLKTYAPGYKLTTKDERELPAEEPKAPNSLRKSN
jgi:hypothetical protein